MEKICNNNNCSAYNRQDVDVINTVGRERIAMPENEQLKIFTLLSDWNMTYLFKTCVGNILYHSLFENNVFKRTLHNHWGLFFS